MIVSQAVLASFVRTLSAVALSAGLICVGCCAAALVVRGTAAASQHDTGDLADILYRPLLGQSHATLRDLPCDPSPAYFTPPEAHDRVCQFADVGRFEHVVIFSREDTIYNWYAMTVNVEVGEVIRLLGRPHTIRRWDETTTHTAYALLWADNVIATVHCADGLTYRCDVWRIGASSYGG